MNSKNFQSQETIIKMAARAFPEKTVSAVAELPGCSCNAVYKISFSDSTQVVLKISSPDKSSYMKNEVNLIDAEIAALKLVKDKIKVQTPKVLYSDSTCEICSGKYFFMEYIDGVTFSSISASLSKEEKEKIDYKSGKLVKEIIDITGSEFGFLADENKFNNLFDFVNYILKNTIADAKSMNLDFGISEEEFLALLERDRRCFEVEMEPTFVHFDLSPENLLVKDNAVVGLIDWERALFGDPLMEDRFRLQKYTLAFFEGFRQSQFNYKETRRLVWYDVIHYLSIMTESKFREDTNPDRFNNAQAVFKTAFMMLSI